ncbi:MAG TPA: hypothetical protein VJZ94_00960 [Candidatus Paceibacterota bacterium]|nr:hypothetical protein [Candidatus Paceibacterota bacterium]
MIRFEKIRGELDGWAAAWKELPPSRQRELVAYLVAAVAIVLALVAPLVAR